MNTELDIGMPTPEEVAQKLMTHFSDDQANDIAEFVYQPLREWVKREALKNVSKNYLDMTRY